MPIRPENRHLYPGGSPTSGQWRAIRAEIMERAGNACECRGECGYDHDGRCDAANRMPHPVTGSIVVLTTAHIDQNPSNNDRDNLRMLCQRCHNKLDAPFRAANRKARKTRDEVA